jgi:hypothetical protein
MRSWFWMDDAIDVREKGGIISWGKLDFSSELAFSCPREGRPV